MSQSDSDSETDAFVFTMKVLLESVKGLRQEDKASPPCARVRIAFMTHSQTFTAEEEGKSYTWDGEQPVLIRGLGEITARPTVELTVTDANNDDAFLGACRLSVRDLVEDKEMSKKLKLEGSPDYPDQIGKGTLQGRFHWWRKIHDEEDDDDLEMVCLPQDDDVTGALDVTNSLTGVVKEIGRLLMKLGDEANMSLPAATIGLIKLMYQATAEDLISTPPDSKDIDIDLDVMQELCYYMKYATAAYGAKETQKELDGKAARQAKEDKRWARYRDEVARGGGPTNDPTPDDGDDSDGEEEEAGPSLAMVELMAYLGRKRAGLGLDKAEVDRVQARVIGEYIGTDPANVVASEWTYRPFHPAWFVARDPRRLSVVLAIRGTNSVHDAITDVLATTSSFYGGQGHKGMIASAQSVVAAALADVLATLRNTGYRSLVVTGHSLGAGTAACVTRILRESAELTDIDVHCYAFACPAVLSDELREEMKEYCISVVHSTDVVPRLSYNTIKELNSRVHKLGLRQWAAVKDAVDETIKMGQAGTKTMIGGAAIGVASTYLHIGKSILNQTVNRKQWKAGRKQLIDENRRRRELGMISVQEETLRRLQQRAQAEKDDIAKRRDAVRQARQLEREAKTTTDLGPPGRVVLIHTLPPRHISALRVHDRRLALLRQKLLDNELTWGRFQKLVIRDFVRPVYAVWEVERLDRIVLDLRMIKHHLVSPYEIALDSVASEFGVSSVAIKYRDRILVDGERQIM